MEEKIVFDNEKMIDIVYPFSRRIIAVELKNINDIFSAMRGPDQRHCSEAKFLGTTIIRGYIRDWQYGSINNPLSLLFSIFNFYKYYTYDNMIDAFYNSIQSAGRHYREHIIDAFFTLSNVIIKHKFGYPVCFYQEIEDFTASNDIYFLFLMMNLFRTYNKTYFRYYFNQLMFFLGIVFFRDIENRGLI